MSLYRGRYVIGVVDRSFDLLEGVCDDYVELAQYMGTSTESTRHIVSGRWKQVTGRDNRVRAVAGPIGSRLVFIDIFEEWRGQPVSKFAEDWAWDELEWTWIHIYVDGKLLKRKEFKGEWMEEYGSRTLKDVRMARCRLSLYLG